MFEVFISIFAAIAYIGLMLCVLVIYFMPVIISFIRHASDDGGSVVFWSVLLINVLFGWTVVVWSLLLVYVLFEKRINKLFKKEPRND